MASASTGSYEGGIGGKFRSRPLRRPPTPYDRPPTAVRNPNGGDYGRNGWLSKLVDPASRVITSSAARLFSSVFRKRLLAPPALAEANQEPGHKLTGPVFINPSSEAQAQGSNERGKPNNSSDNDGINELEQLLQQKTFTRVEIDRLTELLHSRTVDASADDEDKKIEPSTSQMVAPPAGQEKATISTQEYVRSSRLFGSISTPAIDLSVPEEQISSPAELAKAYMGSRSSKLSPPKLGLRNRIFRDDTTSPNILQFTQKSPNVSLGARSVGHFSGVPALSENGYQTPRPRGRSSMSSMTHSPYSRLHSIASLKGTEPIDDGHVGPSTSSLWPRVNNMLSNGNQVLKRRSSIIEFGSVGPIRRVRQKSNLISPLKDVNSTHRSPPVSFSWVGSDAVQGSMSSMQVPLMMDETKYNASNLHVAENRDNRNSTTNFNCLPPQSSEVAQKILQQLEKLAPSPKERSSELKATISKEKSPAISMRNMLNGQPLKIMEDMQTPKFQNAQGGGTLNELSWTRNEVSPGNAISHNQDRGEVNGPMTTAHAVVKVSEASGVEKTVFSVKDTLSGMRHADSAIFGLAANPPCGKQVFQMSAPKESLELDNDNQNSSTQVTAEKEKRQSSASEQKTVVAEAVKAEKPLLSSSGSQPAASLTFNKGADTTMKASDGHIVAEKAATFTSPTTPSLLPTRTVQSSSLFNSSVLLKEQTGTPIFSFDPKSAEKGAAVTFSSISTNASSTLGLKFDSKELLSSNVTATIIPSINLPEATSSGKSDKNRKARDVNISSEKVVASAVSTSTTPEFFAFGASTNSSPSNGFPTPTSASSVSNTPAVHVSLISSSSTATTSSSSSPSTSTAAAPTFHAASMFKLGTTSAAVAHSNSVSLPSTTSGLKPALIETKQASPFSSTISTAVPASPSAFTSSGSSNVFRLSASAPSSTTNSSSSANNQSQNLTSFSGAAGSLFGSAKPFTQSKPSQHAAGSSPFGSSASSPTFGLSGSSSFGSSSSSFASLAPSGQTFGSGSGHGLSSSAPFLAGAGSLSSSSSGSSLFSSGSQPASGTASSSLATGFSFGAIPAAGSTAPPATGFSFGASAAAAGSKSASSPATGLSFGASAAATSSLPASSLAAGFSFGASTTAAGSFPPASPPGTGFSFGATTATAGSLPASSPPATWFSFGASTTAAGSTPASSPPAMGFSFGASAAAASSAPLTFGSSGGASSSSPFSFTSAAAGPTKSLLSPAQLLFGTSIPVVGFRSASPVNVQMNVEDSMAEDTVQASMPVAPAFNQPAQSASPFNFSFSSATPSGGPPAFQFGSQQNPATPQHPSPFPATGSLELPGEGFSLGTGSVDKSSRRIVKVRREKLRKK